MTARDERSGGELGRERFAAPAAVRESFFRRRRTSSPMLPPIIAVPNDAQANEASSSRRRTVFLWIDGVGGYWVCRGERIALGQSSPNHDVDLPIWGDVSRRHAIIARDDEGDAIEALRPTKLDGVPVVGSAALLDGRTVQLGESVRIGYRRPHPLSRTARLEWLGAHRTQPATDGVLLLAETCVLGPAANSHVVCPRWKSELILSVVGDGLKVRYPGEFRVDGQPYRDVAPAGWNSRITLPEGNVTLEEAQG
ncbi:MAG: FHA domain-containing protein [Pirellulales bacterium]